MSDDIVVRLRVLNHHAKKLAENELLHDLHRDALTRCENLTWQAADVIERLRKERNQARAEVVDRALGIKEDVIWDINSPTRKRCENYARSRGWHDLWDAVNEQERLIREGRTTNEH